MEGNEFLAVYQMKLSEQPGRLAAVFVFAPMLYHKAMKYQDNHLLILSVLLFAWDGMWLFAEPKSVVL